jgi:Tropinone reductase 1
MSAQSGPAIRWGLVGKRCIVTGGTKGLGLACVKEFLELGAIVLFTARDQEALTSTQDTLAKSYGKERVHTFAADVSSAPGRDLLIAHAKDLFGGALDVLVNNVGTNIRKPVSEASEEDYHTMVSTNQSSAFFLCKLCLPLLLASSAPCVVNVSSLAGLRSSGTGVICERSASKQARTLHAYICISCC